MKIPAIVLVTPLGERYTFHCTDGMENVTILALLESQRKDPNCNLHAISYDEMEND